MKQWGLLCLPLALCVSLSACAPPAEDVDLTIAVPRVIQDVVAGQEFPSNEARAEMAERIARWGFPVLRDNENMLNYQRLEEFCADVAAGKDGSVTVFYYPWSYITAISLVAQDGELTCVYTQYTAAGVQGQDSLPIAEFTFTERGNLLFRFEETNYWVGFRVLPLSPQSRAYYRDYIEPVTVFTQGPLNVNWDTTNFSALNWDWIFQRLWQVETGSAMVDPASPYYVRVEQGFDRAVLPAQLVEDILQKYFPVSRAELRRMDAYDAKINTYSFTGFNGGGYSPTLEVSKWQEHADGSLTLWIDHVALEYGQELAAQSILTVLPAGDGRCKYLSNQYQSFRS